MKIKMIVSRSILCVVCVASASCAYSGNDRATGHAGVEVSQVDRFDPIAMADGEQRSLRREASAGPTILCDENGPRVVFATERKHRMAHAEEFGFTAVSQRSPRISGAESGYLKLVRED